MARATIGSSDEAPTPLHQPCQPGVSGLLGAKIRSVARDGAIAQAAGTVSRNTRHSPARDLRPPTVCPLLALTGGDRSTEPVDRIAPVGILEQHQHRLPPYGGGLITTPSPPHYRQSRPRPAEDRARTGRRVLGDHRTTGRPDCRRTSFCARGVHHSERCGGVMGA